MISRTCGQPFKRNQFGMPKFTKPVLLGSQHNLTDFDCGKAELNSWLKSHALDKQNAMLSRTYVVESEGRVVGYYTLSHIDVKQGEPPKKFGRGMPSSIPSMLMARFAVDKACQGYGLGRSLYLDALMRTWAVMDSGPAPVRLFVVDAMDDDALKFYERFDMKPAPTNPYRLFLSYKDLRAIFKPD